MSEYIEINPFKRTEAQIIEEECGPPWGFEWWRCDMGYTPEHQREVALRKFEEEYDRREQTLRTRLRARSLIGKTVRTTDPECHPGQCGRVLQLHTESFADKRVGDFPESGIGVLVAWHDERWGEQSCWFDRAFVEVVR